MDPMPPYPPITNPLASSTGDPAAVIFWSLILFGLIVGAFWAVVVIKKRVMDDEEEGGGEGFGLGELRQLHRAGQLSDEECEKAKAALVVTGKAIASSQPEVMSKEKRAAAEAA